MSDNIDEFYKEILVLFEIWQNAEKSTHKHAIKAILFGKFEVLYSVNTQISSMKNKINEYNG